METDLYKTLGVLKNASDAEIKRAYRSLSLKYQENTHTGYPSCWHIFVVLLTTEL